MKFAVKLVETLEKTVIVETDGDFSDAKNIVEDAYYSESIVLSADNADVNLELVNDTENYIRMYGKEKFNSLPVDEDLM